MKDKLTEILHNHISELSEEEIGSLIEVPKKTEMGDYSFPCFKLAKIYRKSPAIIASEICDSISKSKYDEIDKVESVGGYINFFINQNNFTRSNSFFF